jgi:hypothetical protein
MGRGVDHPFPSSVEDKEQNSASAPPPCIRGALRGELYLFSLCIFVHIAISITRLRKTFLEILILTILHLKWSCSHESTAGPQLEGEGCLDIGDVNSTLNKKSRIYDMRVSTQLGVAQEDKKQHSTSENHNITIGCPWIHV